jgi:hypothetical protein
MELDSAEVGLVADLYHRRITTGFVQMILTPAEADHLRRFALNAESIRACAKALGDLEITFPVD